MYGKVEALSKLMMAEEAQKGFKVLHKTSNLDKTFEKVVLNFKQYFKKDIIERAQFRLEHPELF
jgi:hypothetical protein